jgi:glycerophosphoryl diester phosphodiesterase
MLARSSLCCVWMILLMAGPVATAQVIVAHRGASHDAPENTLAAFEAAWQQGADGIEGDFYITRDQRIVCIHDADTARTAGKKLVIADTTLAELRQLDFGKWKGERFANEPIPTFSEVYRCVPEGKLFVIELKTGPEIVPLLKKQLDELQEHAIEKLIIAFNPETVAACKRLLPDVRVHWLTGFKQDKQTGAWAPTLEQVVATVKQTGADGVGFQGQRSVLTPEYIAQCKAGGVPEFHVWTIDGPEDAAYFRSLGTIGITTNRPGFIREALSQDKADATQ